MRFVPVKTEETTDCPGAAPVPRSVDATADHDPECDPFTLRRFSELVTKLRNDDTLEVPEVGVSALLSLASQLDCLEQEVRKIEHQLLAWHRQNATSKRLETIPGIGLITATALAASVPDPAVFKSGRQFAAYLGLVPRQNSSGGKDRLGRISKMGNGYLRRLLVVGATSVTRRAPTTDTRHPNGYLGALALRAQTDPGCDGRHCQ